MIILLKNQVRLTKKPDKLEDNKNFLADSIFAINKMTLDQYRVSKKSLRTLLKFG